MCSSASARASFSVSAMMTSRVRGHSVMGAVRPAAWRFARNCCFPFSRRGSSAVGPGIQLSASVAARREGDVAPPADPDRRIRLGHWLRLELALDLVEPSLERHPVLGPQRLDDRELLLEAGAALLELGSVERELVRLVADGRAHDQPPIRHDVHHRGVLGEPGRMVEGGDQDVGPEEDTRGAGGEAGEHRDRRRPVVVDHGVVLFHPDGVEAEVLSAHHFLERVLVIVAAFDGDEADLEPGHDRPFRDSGPRGSTTAETPGSPSMGRQSLYILRPARPAGSAATAALFAVEELVRVVLGVRLHRIEPAVVLGEREEHVGGARRTRRPALAPRPPGWERCG